MTISSPLVEHLFPYCNFSFTSETILYDNNCIVVEESVSLKYFVCSSLSSQEELESFFETNNVQYLALIFEESKSYVGREVTVYIFMSDFSR